MEEDLIHSSGQGCQWEGKAQQVYIQEGVILRGNCNVDALTPSLYTQSVHIGTKGIFIEVWVGIRHLARAAA